MTPLARRLGRGDAVVIGLGSMIGAGVFAVWAPAAAMALTFAAHVIPDSPWLRPLAAAAVVALAAVNCHGVTRTARLTRVIVAFVLAVLVADVLATASGATAASWTTPEVTGGAYGVIGRLIARRRRTSGDEAGSGQSPSST